MKHKFASPFFTNRRLSDVLPDGSWRGSAAVVVGGGPSFGDFDVRLLKGWRTIGTNLAFMRFDPTVILGADLECLDWILSGDYEDRMPGCRDRFLASLALKAWYVKYPCSLPAGMLIVPLYRTLSASFRSFVFSSVEGLPHGDNVGYLGLQLAVVLGANPIYLVGFDMRHRPVDEGTQTHWHPPHPSGPQPPEHLLRFLNRFQTVAPRIAAAGIRVVNLTSGSALDCFETAEAEEILC